jgi:hypothetical protein
MFSSSFVIKLMTTSQCFLFSEGDLDGEDAHIRVKPEPLEVLTQTTKFSRRELQLMYRGFKQVGLNSEPSLFLNCLNASHI